MTLRDQSDSSGQLALSRSEAVAGEVLADLPTLAERANREHALCRDTALSMAQHAVAAGQALIDAKAQIAHGGWMPWLTEFFDGSIRLADTYMHVARNSQRVANLDAPGLTLRALAERIARIDREDEAERRRREPLEVVETEDGITTIHGDFREALADLEPVDAIITDPPYPAEYLPLYDDLGEHAIRLLKPDGLAAVMVGQSHLPEYVARLGRFLTWRWCGAYLTDGPATRIQGRKVGTKWKPILVFGGKRAIVQDVFSSVAEDKRHHDWGQSESGMADIIERLTRPGDLVLDPFLGAGTTAVVCRDLGRRFVGCDIDLAAVATARERLAA